MMDCVNHFHEIINNIPASQNAFQIAKEAVTKRLASLRTTKMGIINLWNAMKRLGLDYDLNSKVYRDLDGVTLQSIVDFERQQIANKQFRYMILGDESQLDMEALQKLAPVKRLTTEEVFGF
jgi:predicted Zn-dependent peptidase